MVAKTAVPVNLSLADRYDMKEAPVKIGAMNHPSRNPLEEIDWFGRHGFDFVDFTLEPPAADPGQIDPTAIRAALHRHGPGVVAHTAWFIPIGSPFGSIREAPLVEFRRALRAARQIGATVMNVHYGTITLEVFAPQKEYLLLSRDLLRRWWAEA
jgi:sugar phosphate isomerase/epimerase